MNTIRLAITNWRTTFPGFVCILAAFFSQFPDWFEGIVDPSLATKIMKWTALASGLITFATSKSSNVSGNGSLANPTKVLNSDGSNTVNPPLPIALLFLIPALALSSCAWIQSHPNTVTVIETDLVKVGASIAQTALNNGTLDYAQAIPLGLNSITDIVAGLSADKAKPVIASTVNQFSAWTLPQSQVNAIVAAYADAAPETPAARKTVLLGIAGDLAKGLTPPKTSSMAKMKRATYAVEHIRIRPDKPLVFKGVDALKPTLGEIRFQNDPARVFWIRGDQLPCDGSSIVLSR